MFIGLGALTYCGRFYRVELEKYADALLSGKRDIKSTDAFMNRKFHYAKICEQRKKKIMTTTDFSFSPFNAIIVPTDSSQ